MSLGVKLALRVFVVPVEPLGMAFGPRPEFVKILNFKHFQVEPCKPVAPSLREQVLLVGSFIIHVEVGVLFRVILTILLGSLVPAFLIRLHPMSRLFEVGKVTFLITFLIGVFLVEFVEFLLLLF